MQCLPNSFTWSFNRGFARRLPASSDTDDATVRVRQGTHVRLVNTFEENADVKALGARFDSVYMLPMWSTNLLYKYTTIGKIGIHIMSYSNYDYISNYDYLYLK